ncbi:MAG TPA: STAS domain-containing protein [Solirubrobacteraceae bacterium]|nr:STAS domain-containing protein [Solirubrobacteraceae bacterium]
MYFASPTHARVEQIVRICALSISSERDGDVHTLGLTGEVDLANAVEVEHELRRIEATDAAVILVDLAGVSFIDSTGIKVLIAAAARSRGDGRLVLMRPTPAVLRVLRIAGVANLLPLVG